MRYRCAKCDKAPVHNKKLGIRFCRKHGLTTIPVVSQQSRKHN